MDEISKYLVKMGNALQKEYKTADEELCVEQSERTEEIRRLRELQNSPSRLRDNIVEEIIRFQKYINQVIKDCKKCGVTYIPLGNSSVRVASEQLRLLKRILMK